jgi:uncharacterized protein (DUF433 family)
MAIAPRIVADPKVMMGKPVIEGTRITVELILTRLSEGRSVADILTEYPHLTQAQVTAAIDYARALVSHPAEAAE